MLSTTFTRCSNIYQVCSFYASLSFGQKFNIFKRESYNVCPQKLFKRTFYKTFEECVFQPIGAKGEMKSKSNYNSDENKETKKVAKELAIQLESHGQQKEMANDSDTEKQQKILQEYKKAVDTLNSLQSNAASMRSITIEQKRLRSLKETMKYLLRSGLTMNDLASMSFIHVAGTKGKGSTCALTESILQYYGIRTGFYTSPHLVSVTERIRLNGQPISKPKFIQYFWPVYNNLKSQKEYENDMPAYFKFLTILCLHVYFREQVDAVILEVGIGGEFSSTNIVPNTKTVGISSLGLEHTQSLGRSLKEIAWQKAGIIKPNSRVYTSVKQMECLDVLRERAKEKNATLYQVPAMELYFKEEHQHLRDLLNPVVMLNGSLAVQLAYDWLRHNRKGVLKEYEINKPLLSDKALEGLLNFNWPGRFQVVKFFNFNMHLDGAHTLESMQICGEWFAKVTNWNTNPKILIFNNKICNHNAMKLLSLLRTICHFDLVCFVPNVASSSSASAIGDNKSVLYSHGEQLEGANRHLQNWQDLCREQEESNTGIVFPTVLAALQHIRNVYNQNNKQELDILVTGSVHLIGATILSFNELGKDF